MNEFGALSQFLLANPPAGIATGAVGTALLIAFLLRIFRNEVRSAAIDKAAQSLLSSVQEDNKALRGLLKDAEASRDQARKDLLNTQLEHTQRISELRASVEVLDENKRKAERERDALRQELEKANTRLLELEMQAGGQMSTIEHMALKIRNLEQLVGARGLRPPPDMDS